MREDILIRVNDNIVLRETASLIPYINNSRTHTEAQIAQIAASIKEFGFTNPVLLDGESGIVAGHARIMAARLLKMAQVPCIELRYLTEAQRKAYVIADNKLALNAGWDDQLLAIELKGLGELGFDLGLTGFGELELGALFAETTEDSSILTKRRKRQNIPFPSRVIYGSSGDIECYAATAQPRSTWSACSAASSRT